MHYDNPWIRVREDQIINPANKDGIYGVVEFKHLAIGILPVDEQLNTWLVGQYRYPLSHYSWEIPEGGGALGVLPLESAQRELKEETGLVASDWTQIFEMHLSNSATNERAIVFLAENLVEGVPEPEEEEKLSLRKVPLETACQMAMNGEITDAISLASLFWASANLLR